MGANLSTSNFLSQGRIGKVEGLGDGLDVLARNRLTDGLSPAKDPALLGLFERSLSGRHGLSGKLAFEGVHRCAP